MELSEVDQIVDEYNADPSKLVQILIDVQSQSRWLPGDILAHVSYRLGVPLTRVYHVASFYKSFHLTPRGRHVLAVCVGTACHVRGSHRILDKASELMAIGPDQTTPDEKFSLDRVNCLGCCALGPVVVLDQETHGKLPVSEVEELLSSCD